jgi:PhoH-like ATPase
MKAKAVGVLAEDYATDRIGNVEELYSGKEIIEDFDDLLLSKIFQPPYNIPAAKVIKKDKGEVHPNKFYIIRNSNRSVLAYLDQTEESLHNFDK